MSLLSTLPYFYFSPNSSTFNPLILLLSYPPIVSSFVRLFFFCPTLLLLPYSSSFVLLFFFCPTLLVLLFFFCPTLLLQSYTSIVSSLSCSSSFVLPPIVSSLSYSSSFVLLFFFCPTLLLSSYSSSFVLLANPNFFILLLSSINSLQHVTLYLSVVLQEKVEAEKRYI